LQLNLTAAIHFQRNGRRKCDFRNPSGEKSPRASISRKQASEGKLQQTCRKRRRIKITERRNNNFDKRSKKSTTNQQQFGQRKYCTENDDWTVGTRQKNTRRERQKCRFGTNRKQTAQNETPKSGNRKNQNHRRVRERDENSRRAAERQVQAAKSGRTPERNRRNPSERDGRAEENEETTCESGNRKQTIRPRQARPGTANKKFDEEIATPRRKGQIERSGTRREQTVETETANGRKREEVPCGGVRKGEEDHDQTEQTQSGQAGRKPEALEEVDRKGGARTSTSRHRRSEIPQRADPHFGERQTRFDRGLRTRAQSLPQNT
jgi:hypothetical protein